MRNTIECMVITATPLYAGIYQPSKNLGMLWKRLTDGEKIPEDRLGLAASLKHPHHRLEVIDSHGKKPKANQTHCWNIQRDAGPVSMINLRPL